MNVSNGVCYIIRQVKVRTITESLKKVDNRFDLCDITYPALDDIRTFENNTNKVCIYVYEITEKCQINDKNEEVLTHEITSMKEGNTDYIKMILFIY